MIDFLVYDVLYIPLYNALIFFYWVSGFIVEQKDMGLAVIFLTVFMRMVLLPFSIRGARTEHRMERLQPTIDKIKERYRYDLQQQRLAIKTLLQQNKVGVFSNLVSLILQLMVFIVLYKIFSSGLQPIGHNELYTWNVDPGVIHSDFLGWFNLITPNQFASLFAAGVVFLTQALRRVNTVGEASSIEKALLFGLPLGTYLATIILPSAKALFIAASVVFGAWIRLIKWTVSRYLVKNQALKDQLDDLWTN